MKVLKKVNPNITVEANGESLLEVFESLAAMEEAFGESKCGKCGKDYLKFTVRKAKDEDGEEYKYPELRCTSCWAKLTFGQGKKGELYPKRFVTKEKGKYVKDEQGNNIPLGTRGWTKYDKETGKEE